MVSSARSAEERRRRGGGGLKEMIRSESSIVFGCDSNQLICRLVLRGGVCEKLFSKPMWENLIYKIFFPLSHFKEMKTAGNSVKVLRHISMC